MTENKHENNGSSWDYLYFCVQRQSYQLCYCLLSMAFWQGKAMSDEPEMSGSQIIGFRVIQQLMNQGHDHWVIA